MKIAVVSLYPGRAEKHIAASGVASYTKNLVKNIPLGVDDELFIVCNKLAGKAETYTDDGFTIVRAFDRNHQFAGQIYRAIAHIQPDVVHIQHEIPLYGGLHTALMLPALMWALRKYRTVITLHHVVDLQKVDTKFVRANKSALPAWAVRLAFFMVISLLVRWTRATITHESFFKDILVHEYKASAQKVHVIPHGVEDFTTANKMAARKKIGVGRDRHMALSMGYLAGYKGIDLLIEGFAHYAKTDPQAVLVIGAGKHPKFANDQNYLATYEAARQKAQTLIGSQHVWLGFIPEGEIADYYSAADVCLFPYTIAMSSSGPMSFAMGYQKPFLASSVFHRVLPQKVLFAQTPDAMAQKLTEFFADPESFADISARFKAERLWQTVGRKTKQCYERLTI